jgi:hypothetical protein
MWGIPSRRIKSRVLTLALLAWRWNEEIVDLADGETRPEQRYYGDETRPERVKLLPACGPWSVDQDYSPGMRSSASGLHCHQCRSHHLHSYWPTEK